MDRIVLRLMCDDRDEISFLFGPWGAVDRAEATRQIEAGERTYTLQRRDGSRARLWTVGDGESKRLCITADGAELLRPDETTRIGA
jgi:hypothetical protein